MASLRDFYLRTQEDPKYRPDQLEVSDDLEATLQGIRMTLFTNKGEVLGDPDFGVSLNNYLFEYSIDPFSVARDAAEQINRYVGETRKRKIEVKPSIYADQTSNRDILVLLIDVPEVKNSIAIFYD
jgi:phage baseplate assembly protein W